jgi:hypothetical protein
MDCVAVGSAGSEIRMVPIAERWTGTRWKVQLTAPTKGAGQLGAVACPSTKACIAVGFNLARDGTELPLAERLS